MEIIKSYIFVLILIIRFYGSISGQVTWLRSESSSQLEVGDVSISDKNEYFISLKHNHYLFISKDSGANWKEIHYAGNYKFNTSSRDEKHFKVIKDNVYLGLIPGYGKRFIYNGISFDTLSGKTNSVFTDLISDQDGHIFYLDYSGLYNTDLNWNHITNDQVLKTSENSYLINCNLYSENNNYSISTNGIDSVHVMKFNSKSKISSNRNTIIISTLGNIALVSQAGTFYYKEVKTDSILFKYVSHSDPSISTYSILSTFYNVKNIYFSFINNSGIIFIVTNKGIFQNNGIDEDSWIRCNLMSNKLPLPPYNSNPAFGYNYYIKDSLNAIISYGDNCGQSEYYFFSAKYKEWNPINLQVRFDNLTNIVKDVNDRLYAFRPCDNITIKNYLQSDNIGISWDIINILGETVTSVEINKDGEAVAISNNKIFLHHSMLDLWEEIPSVVSKYKDVKMLQFYSFQSDLFLTANTEPYIINEKNYLFHSIDGGHNWNEIKSFVQTSSEPLNDFGIFINHLGEWIVYPTQSQWHPSDVLVSTDQGKTWNSDSRFKNFFFLSSINQLPDHRYLVSANWKYSKRGTFVIDSLGNFEIYTPFYEGYIAKIYPVTESDLFGFSTSPGNYSPFFSKDLGIHVTQDETGLLEPIDDQRIIESAIIKSEDKIILNIKYDGIYTTTHNIFSKANDLKSSNNYFAYQNDASLQLKKSDQSEWRDQEQILIYDILGQLVLSQELNTNKGNVNIQSLNSGIYLLKVRRGKFSSETVKIFLCNN